MALFEIKPSEVDHLVAECAQACASKPLENTLQVLTLAADEHVMLGLTAELWVVSRFEDARSRTQANYIALNAVVSTIAPHLMKHVINQKRPDRQIHGPRHGIPKSGNANDAFPSGHAVHIGAIASAVSRVRPDLAVPAWSIGSALAATRVLVLAHWLSDVVAGLAIGAGLELAMARVCRPEVSLQNPETRAHRRTAEFGCPAEDGQRSSV
jgi:undecaprenyl-diphosphatase